MTALRSTSLLLIGVFVGIALTEYNAARLDARQQEPPAQLTLTKANFAPRILTGVNADGRTVVTSDVTPSLAFVRDTKTNGCWLAALGDRGQVVSLAVAPSLACTQ